MKLNNDITDQFADSEYQSNEYRFNCDFKEALCNEFEEEVREHRKKALDKSLEALEEEMRTGIGYREEDNIPEGVERLINEDGEQFGAYRSKSFSELNKSNQDEYYD